MQQVVSESIVRRGGTLTRAVDPCRFSWRTSASGLQNAQPADSNPNPTPMRADRQVSVCSCIWTW